MRSFNTNNVENNERKDRVNTIVNNMNIKRYGTLKNLVFVEV